MAIHPFTTRAHVLGLPIGARALDWSSVVRSALAVVYVVGTVEVGLAAKHRVDQLRRRWADRVQEGRELIAEGEELLHHAAGVAHTAAGVGHAVSKAGDGISRVT